MKYVACLPYPYRFPRLLLLTTVRDKILWWIFLFFQSRAQWSVFLEKWVKKKKGLNCKRSNATIQINLRLFSEGIPFWHIVEYFVNFQNCKKFAYKKVWFFNVNFKVQVMDIILKLVPNAFDIFNVMSLSNPCNVCKNLLHVWNKKIIMQKPWFCKSHCGVSSKYKVLVQRPDK